MLAKYAPANAAAAPAAHSVLQDISLSTRRSNANTKAGNLSIPSHIAFAGCFEAINRPLADLDAFDHHLPHGLPPGYHAV